MSQNNDNDNRSVPIRTTLVFVRAYHNTVQLLVYSCIPKAKALQQQNKKKGQGANKRKKKDRGGNKDGPEGVANGS